MRRSFQQQRRWQRHLDANHTGPLVFVFQAIEVAAGRIISRQHIEQIVGAKVVFTFIICAFKPIGKCLALAEHSASVLSGTKGGVLMGMKSVSDAAG